MIGCHSSSSILSLRASNKFFFPGRNEHAGLEASFSCTMYIGPLTMYSYTTPTQQIKSGESFVAFNPTVESTEGLHLNFNLEIVKSKWLAQD